MAADGSANMPCLSQPASVNVTACREYIKVLSVLREHCNQLQSGARRPSLGRQAGRLPTRMYLSTASHRQLTGWQLCLSAGVPNHAV